MVMFCRTVFFVGFFALYSSIADATDPSGQSAGRIDFRWAFGAQIESTREFLPIERDVTLQEGDRVQLLIGRKTPAYIYLIYRDVHDEITLLFPDTFAIAGDLQDWEYHVLGPYQLDDQAGTTRLHLLASAEPLQTLETQLSAYAAATIGVTRDAAGKAIVAELRRLRKSTLKLAKPAQRPANLAGVVRGDPSESGLDAVAKEISATGLYARTFTIEQKRRTAQVQ